MSRKDEIFNFINSKENENLTVDEVARLAQDKFNMQVSECISIFGFIKLTKHVI